MVPSGKKAFVKAAEGIERIRTEFHGFQVFVSVYFILQ